MYLYFLVSSFRVLQHIYVELMFVFLQAMMSHDRNALRSGRHHCTWPFPIDIWIVLLGFACQGFGLGVCIGSFLRWERCSYNVSLCYSNSPSNEKWQTTFLDWGLHSVGDVRDDLDSNHFGKNKRNNTIIQRLVPFQLPPNITPSEMSHNFYNFATLITHNLD